MTRVLIIVQNLPVPFDRRVWLECEALISDGHQVAVVCPKGHGDPAHEVINTVELYKYRPYAPGGSKVSFITEYAYSFHNTIEPGGQSQSGDGGPFLWLRHANGHEIEVADDGGIATWIAEQDGHLSLQPPVHHRRLVRLDRATRTVEIVDEIDGGSHDLRLAFHLGPDVRTEVTGSAAFLCWRGASAPGRARLALPRQLRWSLHRGETDPILGWYSCGLGRLTPTCTLIGRGRSAPHAAFVTRLHFPDRWPEQARLAESSGTQIPAVSRTNT